MRHPFLAKKSFERRLTWPCFVLAALAQIAATATADQIYWTTLDDDAIYRANLDGTGTQRLVSLMPVFGGGPTALALDVADSKMYWAITGAEFTGLQRANLNGTSVENLVTEDLTFPDGIELDLSAGKLYWVEAGLGAIKRANLDGTNVEIIISGIGPLAGMALDVAGEQIYFTNYIAIGANGKVQRVNFDGSGLEDLVTTSPLALEGVALDLQAGKMYWAESGAGKIRRADLDGGNAEDVVSGPFSPNELALDLARDKLYWTDSLTGRIKRANLDGSDIEDVLTDLRFPTGLALVLNCGDGVCDADESIASCAPDCLESVPAVSAWGLLLTLLVGLTAGSIIFGRRRTALQGTLNTR